MRLNLFLGSLAFLLFSCGSSSNQNENTVDYYQFKQVDLSDYDLLATIYIPDETAGIGASYETIIEHDEEFKWKISAGPNFQLFIEDWGANSNKIQEFKKGIKADEVFKVSILSEDKNTIIYKRSLIKHINVPKYKHESYHIYALVELDGYYYEIKNREAGDSKKVVEFMAKSVKSLRLKNK